MHLSILEKINFSKYVQFCFEIKILQFYKFEIRNPQNKKARLEIFWRLHLAMSQAKLYSHINNDKTILRKPNLA